MAVNYESFSEEGKFGFISHRYDEPDLGVNQIASQYDNYTKATILSVSLRKPASVQNVRDLLEHAGFKEIEIKDYGTQDFSVLVPQREGQSLAGFVAALATQPEGKINMFPVIDSRVAAEIIGSEIERTNSSLSAEGLLKVSVKTMDNLGGQRYGVGVAAPSYKDVDLTAYPDSAIQTMREDGVHSKFAIEKFTSITVMNGQQVTVEQQLKAAGFEVSFNRRGLQMQVGTKQGGPEASVDNIVSALAHAKTIPEGTAQEIIKARPDEAAGPVAAPVAATQKIQAPSMR